MIDYFLMFFFFHKNSLLSLKVLRIILASGSLKLLVLEKEYGLSLVSIRNTFC